MRRTRRGTTEGATMLTMRVDETAALRAEIEQLKADRAAVLAALQVAASLLVDGAGQLDRPNDHLPAGLPDVRVSPNGVD